MHDQIKAEVVALQAPSSLDLFLFLCELRALRLPGEPVRARAMKNHHDDFCLDRNRCA